MSTDGRAQKASIILRLMRSLGHKMGLVLGASRPGARLKAEVNQRGTSTGRGWPFRPHVAHEPTSGSHWLESARFHSSLRFRDLGVRHLNIHTTAGVGLDRLDVEGRTFG